MINRNFETWMTTMRDSIATWKFYTNFENIYKHVNQIKIELNILNSLIGSKNIENEFIELYKKYPEVLKVIPILIATREKEIKIKDVGKDYKFSFTELTYSIDEYVKFMNNTGLFDLMQNHIVQNLVDYVTGVEAGMDTHGRKNRTGDVMEELVETYFVKYGLIKDVSYFKEMYKSDVEKKFGIDLSSISNDGKTEKRFDFVIYHNRMVYGCECNFYGGGGSKLNETARSYKSLSVESKPLKNFKFVWFTDGVGWVSARNNLRETFDVLENLYNLNDLDNGALKQLLG
jgi:type II restriction enzyme